MKTPRTIFLYVLLLLAIPLFAFDHLEQGLLFSDKDVTAKHTKSNLQVVDDDEVRAQVFQLLPENNALELPAQNETQMSFACWLKPKDIDIQKGTIFGKEKGFYFRYLTNRKLQFNHYLRDDINTPGLLSEDKWQHVGFTLSEKGNLCLFFNGTLVVEDSINADWSSHGGNFLLGTDHLQLASQGFMDEVRIWDRVLTPEEFRQVYTSTNISPPLEEGLLAYFPFTSDLKDLQSNKREQTLVGDVIFSDETTQRTGVQFAEMSYIKTREFVFDKQQTIALWLKLFPDAKGMQALVGSGDFSLRYNVDLQSLWYNVPMQYYLNSSVVNVENNSWVHLAVTINFNHQICFYANGQLISVLPMQDKEGKASNLEIGHSLWNNYLNGQLSELAIWERVLSEKEINEVYLGKMETLDFSKDPFFKWWYGMLLIFLAIALLWHVKSRQKVAVIPEEIEFELPRKNAIFYYDSFKAYNRNGDDVSVEFTPILKRLLCLLLIYPKVYGRHIVSANLSDILWPEVDTAQQKNSRNANMHKLRTVLKGFDGLSVAFVNREWVAVVENPSFIDILAREQLLSDHHIRIPFVSMAIDKSINDSGMETVLQLYDDLRIQQLIEESKELLLLGNYKRLLVLSKLWLSIDALSDEALRNGVDAAMTLGNRERALRFYDSFTKNYHQLLNEEYPYSFSSLLTRK